MSNIDNLLDSTLDDLADLPEFIPFPDGAHKATVEFMRKEVNKKQAVEARFKLIETMEMTDPTQAVAQAGTETSVLCLLDNEYGQGNLKAMLTPIGKHLGIARLGDIMEAAKGMEVVIVTKLRADKEDPNKKYMSVKSLDVI